MATYEPPTEDLTYPSGFNPLVFQQLTDALTIEEGDARYLRFPLGQGAETIPSLTVSGTTTLGGATYKAGVSPAYEIEYPVNNGRFDFYTNTGGGARTRGLKVDATGVHTISKYDTIDETAGTLDIGTLAGRTGAINIGTGAGGTGKTITIGGLATGQTTTINGGAVNISGSGGSTTTISNTGILQISNGSTSAMNIGSGKTGGTIDIGQSGATASTTVIGIGNGNGQTGAINIGTGTGEKSIILGNQGTTSSSLCRLRAYNIELNPNPTTGQLNLATFNTAGTINIGTANSSTTAIEIGTGTGEKSIVIGLAGTTSSSLVRLRAFQIDLNPAVSGTLNLGTLMTGGSITLGGTTGGTNTLTINRPFTPAYLPSAIGATNIGHIATPASANLTPITTANGNLADFSLGSGVWDVQVRVRITGVTASASNFFRLSLSTTTGTQSTYVNDWFADNATGNCNFLVNGKFSLSATTTIYVVGIAGGGVGASTTSNADVQAMRIA